MNKQPLRNPPLRNPPLRNPPLRNPIVVILTVVVLLLTACQPIRPAVNIIEIPGSLDLRQTLATRFRLPYQEVSFLSAEAVEWPDSCLGVTYEGEICAAAITPGYKITLEVDGKHYIYHTDSTANHSRLAKAPQPEVGELVLSWTGVNDADQCSTAQVGNAGVAFAPCGGVLLGTKLRDEERQAELIEFATQFASFRSEMNMGMVEFFGTGTTEATLSEQRAITEWAKLVYQEAEMGRGGASWGLAMAWDRKGGTASYCEHVEIFRTGKGSVATCHTDPPTNLGTFQLSSAQLDQLYAWLDTLAAFTDVEAPASADAMTTQIVFNGTGNQAVTEKDRAAINQFVQEIVTPMLRDTLPSNSSVPENGPIFVDEVVVNVLESMPVQVNAVVRGMLPDPCTKIIKALAQLEGNTFVIIMATEREDKMMCAQVLSPFEQVIELDVKGLAAGRYRVAANEVSTTFKLE